jgi:curved DNA-binding protein CbpA
VVSDDRDYYQILQVDRAADQEVIAAAYKRLASKYHPDVNTEPEAGAKMEKLNEAYEVLSDPERRAQYDREAAQPAAAPLEPAAEDTEVDVAAPPTAATPPPLRTGSTLIPRWAFLAGGAAVVVGVVVILVLFVFSGGGGGESTLDEYFKKLDAVTQDIDKRITDLQGKYANAFQQTKDTQSYLNEYVPTVKAAVDGLDKISPAKETKDAHTQYVAAGRDFVKGIEAAAAKLSKVEKDSDLEAALNEVNDDKDLNSASDRFDKACRDIQKIADDNKIKVDLKCSEAESGNAEPGGPLSLEDYYSEIEGIFQNADEETKQSQSDLDAAINSAKSLDEEISAVDSFLSSVSATIGDSIILMQALQPPAEVSPYHADFLAGANQTLKIASNLQSKLAGIKTKDDANNVIDQFQKDSAPTEARTKAACQRLQGVANQKNINVDLHCED